MAADIAYFAAKTIGMSKVNGRKPCDLLTAARHNLREIQAELGSVGRIDPGRSATNAILAGPADAAEVKAMAVSLLADAGLNPAAMRRDHVQALEFVFSLPPSSGVDPAAYFARCLAWLAQALPLPVLSAVSHADEVAPHLHVLLLPLADGIYAGGKPVERPKLLRLRESFFNVVAGPAGLHRESAKLRGEPNRWAIAAVLAHCEAMGLPAVNGPLWPVLVAAIERDPTAAVRALGIELSAPKDRTTQAEPLTAPRREYGPPASAGDIPVAAAAAGAETAGGVRDETSVVARGVVWAGVAMGGLALCVCLLLGMLFGLDAVQTTVLLAFSALPTASTCYVLAARMGYNGAYVAGLVTLSTLLGMASLPFALGFLR